MQEKKTEKKAENQMKERMEEQRMKEQRIHEPVNGETDQQEMDNKTKSGFAAMDNRGVGVVEIILILVILVGLVLVFQNEIRGIVTNALDAISGGANKIIG